MSANRCDLGFERSLHTGGEVTAGAPVEPPDWYASLKFHGTGRRVRESTLHAGNSSPGKLIVCSLRYCVLTPRPEQSAASQVSGSGRVFGGWGS